MFKQVITSIVKKNVGSAAFVETLIISLVVQVFTFVQGGVVARLLGPSGRGELTVVLLVPTLISSVGMVGLGRVVSREVVKKDFSLSSIYWLTGLLSIVCFLFGVFFLFLSVDSIKGDYFLASMLFLLYIPISQFSRLFDGVDHGLGTLKRLNLLRMLVNPFMVVGLLILHILNLNSLLYVVIVYLSCYLLPCLLRTIYMREAFWYKPRFTEMKRLFKEGLPYCIQIAFNELYTRIDIFLVICFLSTSDLGMYGVGMASAIVLQSITNSASIIAFSRSVNEQDDYFAGTTRLLRVCTLAKLIMSVLLALLLPVLIPLVYGEKFAAAIVLAEILVWGNLFNGLGRLYDECLLGMGVPGKSLRVKMCSGLVLLLVAISLIDNMGLMAVAIGFLIAKIVFWMLNVRYFVMHVGVSFFDVVLVTKCDVDYLLKMLIKCLPKTVCVE